MGARTRRCPLFRATSSLQRPLIYFSVSKSIVQNRMWDVVVLGLGGVGSFALRALARAHDGEKDSKILGIEQYKCVHDKGSSHGKSRVYRKAYFEHPNYVPWIDFSVKEFEKLEKDHNVPILTETGVLMLVPKDDTKLADAALKSAKAHSIPTECLDHSTLQQRYPQFNYEHEMTGVYEPGGGVVKPENAVRAALNEAESNGASIWENTKVISMQEIKDATTGQVLHVEIVVQRNADGNMETIQAKNVLVAAGAWTSRLIPSFEPHLKVIRQLQTWVDVSLTKNPDVYDGSTKMPALVAIIPGLSLPVYVLPGDFSSEEKDEYSTCVKLGIHGRDYNVDPDYNSATIVTAEESSEMQTAIRATFNSEIGALPLTETKPCMYTMTVDDHFMIGVPSGFSRVCAVAGLSGHGFKMVPALGQMLADFAFGKGLEDWNAEFCSPARFGV